jgi:hypothetical protein
MKKIERSELEQWMSVDKAGGLVQAFYKDRETYPDFDFYSRIRGINKDIPEELHPLVLLARSIPEAEELRLAPPASVGPDGEIRTRDGVIVRVQVTSSLERGGEHSLRRELRDTGSYATIARDIKQIADEMLCRILDTIIVKEQRYRKGTDVLLIKEKSVAWSDTLEPMLKDRLAEEISTMDPSNCSATYVIFNETVYQLR